MTDTYLMYCKECSINDDDKKKFIPQTISRKRGLILKCSNCGHLASLNKKLKNPNQCTEEQIEFLRKNYEHTDTSREELVKLFNKEFNKKMAVSSLGFVLTKYKIFKDKSHYKTSGLFYREEHINFLKENYEHTDTTVEELTKMFNNRFMVHKTVSALKHTLKRYKIIKDEEHKILTIRKYERDAKNKYTEEHVEFVRENYTNKPHMKRREVLKMFNEKFDMDISIFAIGQIIAKNNLARGKAGAPSVYTPKVKQFIIKCVREGMTKQECKEACEREFGRRFIKNTIGQIANKMGLHFDTSVKRELGKIFTEKEKEIIKLIKPILKRKSTKISYEIIIRDKIIEEFETDVPTKDIRDFCIRHNLGLKTSVKDNSQRAKDAYQRRKSRESLVHLGEEYDI